MGGGGYFARSRYTPSRGSTRTFSPSLMKSGTWTVTPFESFAGLVLAVLVALRITGEVSTTVNSTTDGSSMPTGRPFSHSTWMCISGCSQSAWSPAASASSVCCSYLVVSITCTPPWSRYKTWNSLVSSGASSTKSVAARRVSKVFPVTRLRSRTCTNARRLPGVRCVKSITRHGCPSIMMTWPRRMSVAFISDGPSSRGGKINRVGAGSTGRGKVAQRERVREIPHALSLPPRAARGPLARRAETVAEIGQPNVARRRVRKGVVTQQGQHLGRPRQDVPQQRRKPLPSPLRAQGREPHLPVEPRHVRGHE